MKKVLALMMVVSLLFLSSCGSSKPTVNTTADENISASAETVESESVNTETVTVAEQVLLDQDGLLITLKSLEFDSLFGPELKVLIENNGDIPVTIQARDSSVNGIMIDTVFSSSIEPGKKANDEITFYDTELKAASIPPQVANWC